YSLLEITIEGGKFHQIRAQLSAAGFPILGDVKYGGERWHDQRFIALCATALSFCPATGGEPIYISIPWRPEWKEFLRF
ncbi:MAG: RluA family pseudouridine synthase, partial [Candidatus Saccharimonadales bacterium]